MRSSAITQPEGYLLALSQIKGIGSATALKLLNHFSNAKAIFEADKAALREAGLQSRLIEPLLTFNHECLDPLREWAEKGDQQIIELGSPLYPEKLSQTDSPPLVLYLKGNVELLTSPQIAVVGSRRPSAQGLLNTQQLCEAICQQGISITSGLAMGIDGEAHRSALAADGYTLAVAGTGLDRVYPAIHRELAHQIAERGLLVSEMPPDTSYDAGSFPRRNRIIAGLSVGTLVIEAARKSGSIITAQRSLDYGREVFAVPGSIHNPLAKGCHQLIKQGAKLVESIEDIIEDIPHFHFDTSAADNRQETRPTLNKEDTAFLSYIDYDTTSIDSIVSRSQLTVDIVSNKLLELELQGWIINSAGGYIRR